MHFEEVGSRAVHLVDEHHSRNGIAIGLTPDSFRLGLHATNSAEHRDHTIEHTHGALNFDGEVDVARSINDVDPVVLPCRGDGSSGNGDPPLTLLGHPVGHGGAVMHLTDLVNNTRIKEDALGGGGFAGINVCGNTDISDAFQGEVASHRNSPGLRR